MTSSRDLEPPASTFEPFVEHKKADRAELEAMPADAAQAAVDLIVQPRLWRLADPLQSVWPGDLADVENTRIEPMESFALDDLAAATRAAPGGLFHDRTPCRVRHKS